MGSPYRDAERGKDYAPYSMDADQVAAVWGISFPNHVNKIEVYESHDGNGESLRDLILQFLQTYDPTAQTQSSNATPKWSPTPPTQYGWYWERFGNDGVSLVGYWPGWPVPPHKLLGGYLWYGPIEAPPL
jgi:hypothetical protein